MWHTLYGENGHKSTTQRNGYDSIIMIMITVKKKKTIEKERRFVLYTHMAWLYICMATVTSDGRKIQMSNKLN